MKRRLALATELSLLVGLVGCLLASCSEAVGPTDVVPVMPLAVGNTWIYEVDDGLLDTFEITGVVLRHGALWYLGSDSMRYSLRDDGLWVQYPSNGRVVHVALSNARVGDTVEFGRALLLLPGTTTISERIIPKTVRSIDTQITVPAGMLRSVAYVLDDPMLTSETRREWFVPGIGLVAGEHATIMKEARRRRLVSYTLR